MVRSTGGLLLITAASLSLLACGSKGYEAPLPRPTTEKLLQNLRQRDHVAKSFKAESVMDYWTGKERVKATVLVMGKRGARMRFNALNPDGGSTAADLACDGVDFRYIDFNNNCILLGACSQDAIAQLLRVRLNPDDFLLFSVGTTPVLPSPVGFVKWDSDRGAEVLELTSPTTSQRQVIVFDGREGHHDILESTLLSPAGDVLWKLTNKEFETIEGKDGTAFRVPEKSRFEQPSEKADLIVRWEERQFNLELDSAKFTIELPGELRTCGQDGP